MENREKGIECCNSSKNKVFLSSSQTVSAMSEKEKERQCECPDNSSKPVCGLASQVGV